MSYRGRNCVKLNLEVRGGTGNGGRGNHGGQPAAGCSNFVNVNVDYSGSRGRGHHQQAHCHQQRPKGPQQGQRGHHHSHLGFRQSHQGPHAFRDDPPSYESVISEGKKNSSAKAKESTSERTANLAEGRSTNEHIPHPRRGGGAPRHTQDMRHESRNSQINPSAPRGGQHNRTMSMNEWKALTSHKALVSINITNHNISIVDNANDHRSYPNIFRGRGQSGRGRGQSGRGRGQSGRGRGQSGRGRGRGRGSGAKD